MRQAVLPMDRPSYNENPHGPQLRAGGSIRFRLWAPACKRVDLELFDGETMLRLPMTTADGWHEVNTNRAVAGMRYRFVLPSGMRVPDPASRFQPEDVHGPSEIVDTASWSWADHGWRGRPWEEAVIYELHLGAFTLEGTFRGAIAKLDHLVSLGVTAIQIMPIADFPGRRNWGYDGVLPYAPDASYGRPEDLKAFIEAAHHRGLMVFLDVVYNHFGPEGNYLPVYTPQFLTDRHKTPWGPAVNFDGNGSGAVRDFVIHNALYWVRDFHVDGLRLDAVHAIVDDSPKHILVELAERVRAEAAGRHVHLILENEENEPVRLEREACAVRSYTAQWNDDVHHVLHTVATREEKGYYIDYLGDTAKLGRALAEGFAFQGEVMPYRGSPRGQKCGHLPPSAFVAFIQNHDQIGNRAFGDRLGANVQPEVLRAIAAVYLLLPQIPMLFMGEEWNASTPFPFFCDFGPELAEAVRKGRREEFARFPEFRDPEQLARILDPQAESTFGSAKLPWDEVAKPEHAAWLDWYRAVLAKRREVIVPLISAMNHGGRYQVVGDGAIVVRWDAGPLRELVLLANLSDKEVNGFPAPPAQTVWQEGSVDPSQGMFQPWSVLWTLNEHVSGE